MTTQIFVPAMLALQRADDGLTGTELIQSLPHDPASIFTLVLIVSCVGAVLWFGRPRGGGDKPGSVADKPGPVA